MSIEDGLDYDDLKEAVHNVDRFLCEIERALERHGLKEQVLRWFWEYNVPSAPGWTDHGKSADAEAIWRAAHPLREDSDDEADAPPA